MNQTLSMDQVFLNKITGIIEANLENEKFGVDELSNAMAMSHSNIHRKLKSIANKSITAFIREFRLQRSMEMLQQNVATISEIAFRVGFGSPVYFNKCFHDYFGYPPGEVKKMKAADLEKATYRMPSETVISISEPEMTQSAKKKWEKRLLWTVAVILSVMFILFTLIYIFNNSLFKPAILEKNIKINEKSIAVFPFKNLGENPGNQPLTDGIMEGVHNHLSKIRELRVISRSTIDHFKGRSQTPQEFAKKLEANYVLEGSVQNVEKKVRVNIELYDMKRQQNLWAESYDKDLIDILTIQSDIAKQVASELQTVLSVKEIKEIEKLPTKNLTAYNLYLEGGFYSRQKTADGYKKSIELLEKSIVIDPEFALAYLRLAFAYKLLAYYNPSLSPPDGLTKARSLSLKALEIDKNLAAAHANLFDLALYDYNWEEARKQSQLVLKCDPKNPGAQLQYAIFLHIIGKEAEARKQINLLKEHNPLNFSILEFSSWYNYNEGNIEEEIRELRKMQEIDSSYTHIYRRYFQIYLRKGEFLKAVEALQKVCNTDPLYAKYANDVMNAYNETGIEGALNVYLKAELENKNPIYIAAAYIHLNKKNEALNWLEKAYEMRFPMLYDIYCVHDFESLHSEPRFIAIIKKMGLWEYYNNPVKSKILSK